MSRAYRLRSYKSFSKSISRLERKKSVEIQSVPGGFPFVVIQLAMQLFFCENFIGIALIAMHDNALSTIPNSTSTRRTGFLARPLTLSLIVKPIKWPVVTLLYRVLIHERGNRMVIAINLTSMPYDDRGRL